MPTTLTQQNPACPECGCKRTTRKGKRRNRLEILQVFRCAECLHRFTGEPGKNKTYPLKIILESISTFNLGYSLTETQRLLRQRFHRDIPARTISSWLTEYRPLATYARLRSAGRKTLQPRYRHRLPSYAPIDFITSRSSAFRSTARSSTSSRRHIRTHPQVSSIDFTCLKEYLASIEAHFPHQLFQETEHRSSKFPAEIRPPVTRKENYAARLAAVALPTSPNNKKRHETLQRFMLMNDSVRVAVEIPVFLTREDVNYYRVCGFDLDFESDVITGHIDFLQIRNGHIHILDYKPEAAQRNTRACATHHLRTRHRSQDQPAAESLQVRLVRRKRLL